MKQSILKLIPIMGFLMVATLFNSCEKGEQGPAGKDGNANVYSTNEFTAYSNNWAKQTSSTIGTYYTLTVSSPPVTTEIAEKGVVLCFIKLGDKTWFPLPYDDYIYFFTPGGIAIIYEYGVNPGTQTFRLVAIASSELAKHPDTDLKDYSEVIRTFNQ